VDEGVSLEASFAHRMQRTLKEFETDWDAR
jgi:hypothetical protein